MIKGYDFSHYQGETYQNYRDGDFYILKATEGIKFKDKKFNEMASYFRGICAKAIGAYHYAHPEKNSWKKEADHFLKTVKSNLPCVLALDWEGEALKCDIKWARAWLDYVFAQTGIRPLFYCQSSYVDSVGDAIVSGGYGLWVARYTNIGKPKVGKWGKYAIWQKTSKPVDTDYFNGTLAGFLKYGAPVI